MKFDTQAFLTSFMGAVENIPIVIFLMIVSLFLGLILGFVIALIRFFNVPFFARLFQYMISFLRGIPLVLYLLISYGFMQDVIYPLANANNWIWIINGDTAVYTAVIGYTIYSMVSSSEVIRGALNSIDASQFEAAYACGLSVRKTLERIIIPQLSVVAIPMIGNSAVSLLKATSVASIIGVTDIVVGSQIRAAVNYAYIEAYLASGVLYWILAIIMNFITSRLIIVSRRRFGVV